VASAGQSPARSQIKRNGMPGGSDYGDAGSRSHALDPAHVTTRCYSTDLTHDGEAQALAEQPHDDWNRCQHTRAQRWRTCDGQA
jgi:hypothetical protein